MCPDRQIISLYFDKELPSPWKEKMEAHLGSCPKCQAELAGYRQLTESLLDLQEGNMQVAQERVWQKLTAPAEWRTGKKKLMHRTVTLPLPAAAAALLVIAFSLVFIFMRADSSPHDSVAVLPDQSYQTVSEWSGTLLGDDHETILPTLDMNDFLQYLLSQNEGDFVVVRLPESSNFSRTGRPTLVNAADYSGGFARR